MIFKNKKIGYYFFLQFVAVVFFALLYWIENSVLINYPEIAEKLGISVKDLQNNRPIFDFQYWLWFSLVTQATLGYEPSMVVGEEKKIYKIKDNLFKIINFMQILGVFGINGLMLSNFI